MAIINTKTIIVLFCTLSLELIIFSPRLSLSSSIHDLLISKGLPAGLLPKEVKSYTLSEDGYLEVFLDGPCLTKYENRVLFESVVRANLTYLSLSGVVGLSQEELFLWLPVRDITVDDPGSGLILFDIGVAHKQLSLSLFEYPPNCELKNDARKETGFEAER
ncbi:T31J12.3 PROTEIN-RELATED [Salix viminalis]|uniref:T31J12.3 PROTEIN-RELATED n=1 Tax=Salix viminalis TaxID=40686 RepID=A0A9Q0U6G5_SALVM|nr:T31J12.3 PROTEIN-RELATED [Salix viminalis]